MPECYIAIGATLAGMVNIETLTDVPPHFLPSSLAPLRGGVRRRALSGRMRADGFANGSLTFDYLERDDFNALVYAHFGGFSTQAVQRYLSLIAEDGFYAPFYGWVEQPTYTVVNDTFLRDVVFPLADLTLQSVTKTGDATLTSAERFVYANTGSGNIALTLCPASAVQSNTVVSIHKSSASNTLTIQRNGSDTINGGTSALTRTALNARVTLVSNGVSNWTSL